MVKQSTVPEDFEIAYRRIMPYLAAPLQKEPRIMESLLLYLKLGGERLARIAIDALNVSQRQHDAEMLKLLRQEAMLSAALDEADEQEDDDDFDEDEHDDSKKE